VKEALRMAVRTIRKDHPEQIRSVLVADGGGENHGAPVEDLLEEETPPELS